MSNVELPLVPSARSASASSSRSSLQSGGSDQSVSSSKSRSSQRSLAETLSDDDDQQDYDGENDGQDEEEPQEASGGLWDEVESFLNKPSPSLSALAKTSKKQPSSTSAQAKSILPNLKAEAPRRNSQSDNQGGGVGGRPTRPSRVVTGGVKAIDPKLLEEAFAYARKAQAQMMNDDDPDEDDLPVGGRMKPGRRPSVRAGESTTQGQDFGSSSSSSLLASASRPSGGLSAASNSNSGNSRGAAARAGKSREADKLKKKAGSSSAYGGSAATGARKKSERRLKEASAASAQWNSTLAAEEIGGGDDARKSKKASMDPQTMQELVSSLQNGSALEELRRGLAASQQSLALSRQVLHEAAKTFFQPS